MAAEAQRNCNLSLTRMSSPSGVTVARPSESTSTDQSSSTAVTVKYGPTAMSGTTISPESSASCSSGSPTATA